MKIGLIGFGYWGAGFVARNLARVFDLAVIVDPDPERLVEAAKQWSPWGARVASEPEVAFRYCDAVWIATPADTHYPLVKEALNNGLHVMCEKPFVLSLDQAEELTQLAEENGLGLMVGHVSLFTGAHAALKANLSYDAQITTIKRHTDRPSLSDHSVLWGLGPHDVASIIDCLGEPESVAWAGNQHRVEGVMHFERGDVVNISLDWLAINRERVIRVGGRGYNLCENLDRVEPLFAEARAFRDLCENYGMRQWALDQAVAVTRCLSMEGVLCPG